MAESTCSIDGCEKVAQARTWCSMHYSRWRIHGDPMHVTDRSSPMCSVDGCERVAIARSLCSPHYQRMKHNGDPGAGDVRPMGKRTADARCAIDGCDLPVLVASRQLCSGHYQRWKRGNVSPETPLKPPPSGEMNYSLAHARVRKERGSASRYRCIECGGQAEDWAYDHADPHQLTTQAAWGGIIFYSADVEHYQPMCRSCHIRADRARAKAKRTGAA